MSGILFGVVKVGGFFTSSVTNSAVGQKFFRLLPGEVVLATVDGFSKLPCVKAILLDNHSHVLLSSSTDYNREAAAEICGLLDLGGFCHVIMYIRWFLYHSLIRCSDTLFSLSPFRLCCCPT